MKGLIHIYTGDGKGKTTAALGLALRAAGQGMRVVIVQFLKGSDSGEVHALCLIPGITLLRNQVDYGFFKFMTAEEQQDLIAEHNDNLQKALTLVQSGNCDMLILDECIGAYTLGALDRAVIDDLLHNKPAELELVLTGRDPTEQMLAMADYVTEMRKIRHPYEQGVSQREGIEY